MDLDIRRIDNTDYDKCLEIARDLKEWFNERGISKMTIDLRVHEAYGAYLNGELVGFVVLRFERSFAEIVWMAVKRKYQGKSIGTRLLNFIEYVVRGRDVKLLIVKTSGDPGYQPYVRTRGFYERRGFTPILLVDPYPDWGEPMILYAKPIC
jgi:GNAT superfamily N-acetyltransferase